MTAHSKIGASSMHRWAACPGSVRLSRGIPNTSSVHAEEGTKAHELAELILTSKFVNYDDYDFEMIEYVQMYVRFVQEERKNAKDSGIEERFDLSELHPGLFGTCDAWIYDGETLHVIDLKYGQGIAVEAENNKQLKYYALGALLKLKLPCKTIRMTIFQPRCFHPEGPVRSHEVSVLELLDFSSDLIDAAIETEKSDAKLLAGEHCRFCPAAPTCPELHETAIEAAKNEFSPAYSYNPEKLGEVLSLIPAIEAWAKSVKEFAFREAEAGRVPPGFKLVPKRAHRKWKDTASVEEKLLQDFGLTYIEVHDSPPLKSPAEIEKLLDKEGKAKLAELYDKGSSGNTLAPVTDKRKESRPAIETEFTKIGASNEN